VLLIIRGVQKKLMYYFSIYFFTALIITIIFIKIRLKKNPSKESIKEFLSHHHHKNGTPNQGGVCMFLALLPFFLLTKNYILLSVSTIGLVLGFLDDGQKSKGGLNNKLRIFLWSLTGMSLAFYRYYTYGGQVYIPIINIFLDLKYFYVIFGGVFVYLGTINGVNMTDGLDGMVTFPLITNILFISIVSFFTAHREIFIFSGSILGVLMGFLYMNIHKAKIFMGDSGSVFLGMLLASLFILLRIEFFLLITGMVFVVNILSSFLQVVSIRYYKKPIFKMAPIHHHFELLGHKETSIVFYVWWWSLIFLFLGLFIWFL